MNGIWTSHVVLTNITYIAISHIAHNTMSTPKPSPSASYTIPTKHILSKAHLAAFQRSKTHSEIFGFIEELNEDIVGKKLTEAGQGSEVSPPPPLLSRILQKKKKAKLKMTLANTSSHRHPQFRPRNRRINASSGQQTVPLRQPCVQNVLRQSRRCLSRSTHAYTRFAKGGYPRGRSLL